MIIQELREASDDHEIDALEYLIEKAHSRPLGHPVGGKVSDVKKISTKQIRAYFRKYFSPERMIITIASSYKDKSLRDILSKKFYESEMNKDKIPFRLPARNTVKKLKHINSKINKKMDSAILFISFDGPSLSSDKYYIYSLMDEFLFDGLSSVFFRKFREECPYVYGIDSSIDSYAKCGQYIMTFNTQRKHLNHLYEEVFKVLYDISMGIISLDTLELIKHRAIENWEVSFDSLDERADYIANNEAYELNELDITKVSEKIMQVDIKAVQNLARTLYNSDHAKLMVFNKDNK